MVNNSYVWTSWWWCDTVIVFREVHNTDPYFYNVYLLLAATQTQPIPMSNGFRKGLYTIAQAYSRRHHTNSNTFSWNVIFLNLLCLCQRHRAAANSAVFLCVSSELHLQESILAADSVCCVFLTKVILFLYK